MLSASRRRAKGRGDGAGGVCRAGGTFSRIDLYHDVGHRAMSALVRRGRADVAHLPIRAGGGGCNGHAPRGRSSCSQRSADRADGEFRSGQRSGDRHGLRSCGGVRPLPTCRRRLAARCRRGVRPAWCGQAGIRCMSDKCSTTPAPPRKDCRVSARCGDPHEEHAAARSPTHKSSGRRQASCRARH